MNTNDPNEPHSPQAQRRVDGRIKVTNGHEPDATAPIPGSNPFCDRTKRPKPVYLPPAVWERIQHEYVLGEGSTRVLAAKHGVRLSTLQTRCHREEWVELRAMRVQDALDDLIG